MAPALWLFLGVLVFTKLWRYFQKKKKSSRVSIFFLLFSHGNEGIFYGYDGAYPAHKAIVFVIFDKS